MSKFVSDDLHTIEFDDGEWVKIPAQLSVLDAEALFKATKDTKQSMVAVVAKLIKEWNFKDRDGKVVEVTLENVRRLDIDTWKRIQEEITEIFQLDKKKSPSSEAQ